MVRGDSAQGVGDDPGLQQPVGLVADRRALWRLSRGHLELRATGAPFVDDQVTRDGEQPCPCRALGLVEDLGVSPGTKQRLLDDVLGTRPVAVGQTHAVTPEGGRVLVVELPHEIGLAVGH